MPMLKLATRTAYQTLLDAAALQQADERAAIIYVETDQPDTVITRADFRREVRRYAAALKHLGVKPHDLIIVAHVQNLESIYLFWGAMLVGAIPSMFPTLTEKLDPQIYMRNMGELVRLSGVRAVLTTDDFAPTLGAAVDCPVYGSNHLRGLIPAEDVANFEPHAPAAEEIAFLQHSSGTTGLQKGVALSHQAVLNQIASYSDALALQADDVVVSWLSLYHDMGLIAGFLMPLIQGVPLVLMSPFDWVRRPSLLFRAIHAHKGTLCWLPNFAYNHCARRVRSRDIEGLSLASMRAFINCSEPVRHDSHQLFLARFASLGVCEEMLAVSYAMAENTFAVTQTPLGQSARRDIVDGLALDEARRAVPATPDHPHARVMVSCGLPIPHTEVRVAAEDGTFLDERHVGELVIRSDCMLSGYYKRPDLDPFRDGWYFTGDMGYIADGEVYVIGRKKDLIINAGKNVYPQDIEAIINTVDGVHPGRAVVFGVPDEREGTELIAAVAEVDTDDPAEHKRIIQAIRQAVASQTTVTLNYVHLVGEKWLIKTSSGKISRAANRQKWLQERGG